MMIAPEVAVAAIVFLMGAAGALWRIPDVGGCPRCPHCLLEQEAQERAQRELQHDVKHKGFGFPNGARDRFPCENERCPRYSQETRPSGI